ncbi:MAG: class I SAM-dependent RNA methyltransferase [Pseudoruegeria sp.]
MSVTIERLGHLGDGIAAGPVFANMTLPGEVIEGEIVGDRIVAPKIITPSPDRVRALCRHFKSCGGCLMQHASDDLVAQWKQDIVVTALTAQGLSTEFRPVDTSPSHSRRRAILSGRRTKKGSIVGFHGRGSDAIIEISECHLLDPQLFAQLEFLKELTVLGASRKGEVTFILVQTLGGVDVAASNMRELDGPLRLELTALGAKAGLARLCWNGEVIAEWHSAIQKFGKAKVNPPPGAFLQATLEGEVTLLRATQEAVGDAKRVVDLFSGCGTFSLPLANTAELHAVEGVSDMLNALSNGWRAAPGLKRVSTETRDLFRRPLTPDEFKSFDAVVIDPPRAGAEAQVTEIAQSTINRIAYVSCSPQTFARDAKILAEAGFKLDWVQVVDQFRWSNHVELAACLTR